MKSLNTHISNLFRNGIRKNSIMATIVALGLFSQGAVASDRTTIDYATVTSSTPVYRTIENRIPHERCWVDTVREETRIPSRQTTSSSSATGTILGGVIGGAIGHAVGNGKDNKKIGAVVGSMVGMAVGNDVSKRRQTTTTHPGGISVNYRNVERCEVTETIETRQELVGYDVNYHYRGQSYSTRMNRDPGDKLKVAIHVEPILD